MSKKFAIEVRFTGISVMEANEVLEEMNLNTNISARGFWHILPDEYADRAIIDGELVWRDSPTSSVSNLKVQEYSGKLVTPLMTTWDYSTMRLVVGVMNLLYEHGAVVISPQCVKVHFLGGFSGTKAETISRKISAGNKLLDTMLFFPSLFAPFWIPNRSTDVSRELEVAIYHTYKEIIDGISSNDAGMKIIFNGLVGDLLYDQDNMVPEEDLGKYRSRFDRDSSPDSEDTE